jgi:D-alanyl-D-alanine carboxypeptidase (penicillin-binding protein 5/6)
VTLGRRRALNEWKGNGEGEVKSVTERSRATLFRVLLVFSACAVAGSAALAGGLTPVQASSTPAASSPAAQGRPAAETAQGAAAAQQLLAQSDTPAAPKNLSTVGGRQLASPGTVVNYPSASTPRVPNVRAAAYVIADAGTGQVLAARDPHGQLKPASTLKILTATTLIPLLNPNASITASTQATSVEPNIVGLVPGASYKVSDLYHALLLISANDAAIALAQGTGSLSNGVALMNAEAHHLQAWDTVAKDPNGLDAPGQHVSAYDLALIARQALMLPAFLRYDQTRTFGFKVSPAKNETLVNQNSLLSTYPGGLGGKIGWTSAAGATYVGLAKRNGVTLIVTLLHCPVLTEVNYAKSLLNWGFATDGKVTPVGQLISPLPARTTPKTPTIQIPQGAAQPVTAGDLTASQIPSGLAAASIALIVCAAAAAIVLMLLRRRIPTRTR